MVFLTGLIALSLLRNVLQGFGGVTAMAIPFRPIAFVAISLLVALPHIAWCYLALREQRGVITGAAFAVIITALSWAIVAGFPNLFLDRDYADVIEVRLQFLALWGGVYAILFGVTFGLHKQWAVD